MATWRDFSSISAWLMQRASTHRYAVRPSGASGVAAVASLLSSSRLGPALLAKLRDTRDKYKKGSSDSGIVVSVQGGSLWTKSLERWACSRNW